MKFIKILVCLVVFLGLSIITYADVPKMINYQGKITRPSGALVDTITTMVFSVYADSTGGTALWTETQTVDVQYGVFSVLLGSVNPILDSVFNGDVRYLGITVVGDSEMTPRKAIVSVGYAYHSGTADTAYFAMPDADWTIKGDTIYHVNGNVGIGTTTPDRELDIAGHSGRLRVLGRYSMAEAILETLGDGGVQWQLQTGNNASTMNGRFRLLGGPNEWLTILPGGNVGIDNANPQYRLDVEGYVQADGYYTGDIIFQKDKEKLWRMFEDEDGLYLENLKTGKVYRFVLQEVEKE